MSQFTNITGLDNYNLNGHCKFDKETGNLIKHFLARLPYTGNLSDFPLLKAEMEKVSSTLGPAILLVDSYIGIKEIFKPRRDLNLNISHTPCSLKNTSTSLVFTHHSLMVQKQIAWNC